MLLLQGSTVPSSGQTCSIVMPVLSSAGFKSTIFSMGFGAGSKRFRLEYVHWVINVHVWVEIISGVNVRCWPHMKKHRTSFFLCNFLLNQFLYSHSFDQTWGLILKTNTRDLLNTQLWCLKRWHHHREMEGGGRRVVSFSQKYLCHQST